MPIKQRLAIAARFSGQRGTQAAGRCYGGMPSDRLDAPKCKFCSGRLRFDFERKTIAPGFSYFRCEDCDLSNVFSAQSAQSVFPHQ